MNKATLDRDSLLWELGRFVNQFALTESMVFMFISQLIGLKREESAAIISGLKTDASITCIKRIFEARNQVIPKQISASLEQLNAINTFRNTVLHGGIDWSGLVSNHVKSLPTRTNSFTIKPANLANASVDLVAISTSLFIYHAPITSENEVETKRIHDLLTKPWLYISPQPNKTHQQTRSSAPKNKRPRKPFL